MFKKTLVIMLMVGFGFQATAAKRGTAANNSKTSTTICQFHAGDTGLLKYKANSYEDALNNVVNACFSKRKDIFTKTRNEQPDQDREILCAENCLNETRCS